jgi:uncharacterized membrane protein YiaA
MFKLLYNVLLCVGYWSVERFGKLWTARACLCPRGQFIALLLFGGISVTTAALSVQKLDRHYDAQIADKSDNLYFKFN